MYKHKISCPYSQDNVRCTCRLTELNSSIDHISEGNDLLNSLGEEGRDYPILRNANRVQQVIGWLERYRDREYELDK